ncbi:KdsC family phosphatase [Marinagarivorans algicola]|uniref:KdsC family phosphatase n=1 Tax=Marinagarivorans algicola TaxID=1513270 RepID=UPI003735F4B1
MTSNTFNNAALLKAKNIRLLVLDVDGILSDGRITFSESGEELKSFHTLDGQGIRLLLRAGIHVAVITGRKSTIVAKRCADLGISLVAQGREDKYTALQELLATLPTPPAMEHIAHMGDDLPDLLIMTQVGLALSVPNGHIEVRNRAHWQSSRQGGQGAVREACDALLLAQEKYQDIIDFYTATIPAQTNTAHTPARTTTSPSTGRNT